MLDHRELAITDALDINPQVKLARGESYAFVEMADITEHVSRVRSKARKTFIGAGARFRDGDTLFARITPCLENGKIARFIGLGEEGFGSTEFIVLRGRDGLTTTDYAHYVAISAEFRRFAISKMTGSSGRQRVPVEALRHYNIRVPPLDIQRAITKILGDLDDKIDLLREMNATLEETARAVFRAWFVDFQPVHAKAAGAVSFRGMPQTLFDQLPASFSPSTLGDIPKGWTVEQIGSLAECVGGGTPSTKNPVFWNEGIHPFCTPKDMSRQSSFALWDTERYLTDMGVENISSGALPVGTVLLSSRAPIGYIAINYRPVSINQGIIGMKPTVLPAEYLRFWLEANMETIKANAGGTTFAEISKSKFRPILALRPQQESVIVYSQLTRFNLERIAANELEIQTLATLRDTLLPKLISGELPTPALDAIGLRPTTAAEAGDGG